jgi:hypothetical protein
MIHCLVFDILRCIMSTQVVAADTENCPRFAERRFRGTPRNVTRIMAAS